MTTAHTPGAPTPETPLAPGQTTRAIQSLAEEDDFGCPCDLIVLEDATGELTQSALEDAAEHTDSQVLSWASSYRTTQMLHRHFAAQRRSGRLVLHAGEEPQPLEEAVAQVSAHSALMLLPGPPGILADRARRLAVGALAQDRDDMVLTAGGRTKHMSPKLNTALGEAFAEVRAGRGVGKSRALQASAPRADTQLPTPRSATVEVEVRGTARPLELHAIGGAFGGVKADAGSLLLLRALDASLRSGDVEAQDVVDLGCGNGLLSLYLAAALPQARLLASDDDADAVVSTRLALEAAQTPAPWRVTWDDALSREAAGSADLVLLNPPFHENRALDPAQVGALLEGAAKVLRPDGRLWFVHNSHLRYRPQVEQWIGPVRQEARDSRFTVLSARRRPAG